MSGKNCAMTDEVFNQMRGSNGGPKVDVYYLVEVYGQHPVELKASSDKNFGGLAYNQAVYLKRPSGSWHRVLP